MSSYSIKSLEHYFKVYRQSVRKPKKFWGKIAENNFTWYRKWDKVLEYDMERAEFTWYKNAKLNITKNCIDRHLANKGDETAIIFEPNDPEEPARRYTYSELYAEVSKIVISAIPFVTPTKPTYASLPFPGIQPVLMDDLRNEIEQNQKSGNLCIAYPWPGMARTIWGDHQRFIDTYFTKFPGKYFSGDGALRDEVGYYRITGRVDDVVIVSGHNMGTAPIEDVINQHQTVAESAVVGFPHEIKGNALYGFVVLKETGLWRDRNNLVKEINQLVSDQIGPIAKLDKIQFVTGLPKTRSGKIMRRILRRIAEGESDFGDITTLVNPEIVEEILHERL